MSLIIEMFSYNFIIRAFIGGTLFALCAPLVGHFMVLRGYSNISDGISHLSLLGIAAGLIYQIESQWIAIVITILLSFGMEYLRRNEGLRSDTAIAVFVILSLSLITVLQEIIGFNQPLESLLFGSILTISLDNIWEILVVGIIAYTLIILNYKKLMNILIDPVSAKLFGVNVKVLDYLLIAITAAIVAVGVDIVGGLLISSLMILPVVSSLQFGLGFRFAHIASIILAVVSVWAGIVLSWVFSIPTGGTIALVSLSIFTLAIIGKAVRV